MNYPIFTFEIGLHF